MSHNFDQWCSSGPLMGPSGKIKFSWLLWEPSWDIRSSRQSGERMGVLGKLQPCFSMNHPEGNPERKRRVGPRESQRTVPGGPSTHESLHLLLSISTVWINIFSFLFQSIFFGFLSFGIKIFLTVALPHIQRWVNKKRIIPTGPGRGVVRHVKLSWKLS